MSPQELVVELESRWACRREGLAAVCCQLLVDVLTRTSAAELACGDDAGALAAVRSRWSGGSSGDAPAHPVRGYADILRGVCTAAVPAPGSVGDDPLPFPLPHVGAASGRLVVEWSCEERFDTAWILGTAAAGRSSALRDLAFDRIEWLVRSRPASDTYIFRSHEIASRFHGGLSTAWSSASVGSGALEVEAWAHHTAQLVEALSRWSLLRLLGSYLSGSGCLSGVPAGSTSEAARSALRKQAAVSPILAALVRRMDLDAQPAERQVERRRRRDKAPRDALRSVDSGRHFRRSVRLAARSMWSHDRMTVR